MKKFNFPIESHRYFKPDYGPHVFEKEDPRAMLILETIYQNKPQLFKGVYLQRLKKEMTAFKEGPKNYFDGLLVIEDINYYFQQEEELSVGRGSVSSSLVFYGLGITHIDPVEKGLIFELYWEKNKDVNFSLDVPSREVFNYVQEKYGRLYKEIYQKRTDSLVLVLKSTLEEFSALKKRNIQKYIQEIKTLKNQALTANFKEEEFLNHLLRTNLATQDLFFKYPNLEPFVREKIRIPTKSSVAPYSFTLVDTQREEVTSDEVKALCLGVFQLISFSAIETLNNHGTRSNWLKKTFSKDFFKTLASNSQEIFHDGFNFVFLNPSLEPLLPPLTSLDNIALRIALARPSALDAIEVLKIDVEETKDTFGLLLFQEQAVEVISRELQVSMETAVNLFSKFQRRQFVDSELLENNETVETIKQISPYLFSKAYALSSALFYAFRLSFHPLLRE